MKKGLHSILFLSTSSSKTQETNLVYYAGKKRTGITGKKQTSLSDLSEYCVDSSADFDTEEFVRDMFVNEESLPDVLVCMDEVVTECVYQALVDYNQVGNVKVIGLLLFRCDSECDRQGDPVLHDRDGYG